MSNMAGATIGRGAAYPVPDLGQMRPYAS